MRDPEIEELRNKVHCAVVLERTPPPWQLDRKESTKLSLKYRRGKGEILIISHGGQRLVGSDQRRQGRCLWSGPTPGAGGQLRPCPQAPARLLRIVAELSDRRKGRAPQSFGQIRSRTLGGAEARVVEFADRALSRPEAFPSLQNYRDGLRDRRPAARPRRQRLVRPFQQPGFGHPCRHSRADLQRLAHRRRQVPLPLAASRLAQALPRLVLAEAAIDALSVSALEDLPFDTIYAATGGGMGPGTIAELEALLAQMAMLPGAVLCSATDANGPGDRFAERHRALAEKFGVRFERLRPPIEGGDWNDVLRAPGEYFGLESHET